jgi:hypothetical protein
MHLLCSIFLPSIVLAGRQTLDGTGMASLLAIATVIEMHGVPAGDCHSD